MPRRKPNPIKYNNENQHGYYIANKKFVVSDKIVKEIKYYQSSTDNLIPKLPFQRLCREIFQQMGYADIRIQRLALEALQHMSEVYLVNFFEDSYLLSMHAKRATLMPADMRLLNYFWSKQTY